MLEVLASAGEPCVAATIVRASGSVPRPVGTSMLISGSGQVTGSLSGGCVEASVIAVAEDVFADERARLEVFGYSDDDAFAVGLSCGGTLDVLVEPVAAGTFPALAGAPCALIRALPAGDGDGARQLPLLVASPAAAAAPAALLAAHGPELAALLNVRPEAALPNGVLQRAAARLSPLLAAGRTGVVELDGPGSGTCEGSAPALFLESRLAPPRLVLIGANDFSAALARQGRLLGYHVTVCDARPVFTTPERFPAAHSVQVQWPDQYLRGEAAAGRFDARTVVCVLSHDAKFDVPALVEALRLDLGYVGAMGSRRSHDQRLTALHAAGLGAAELQALHSPLGLDIGAATPEETAVSVFAEIVAARSGTAASGRPLRAVSGPIHPHTSLTS
ncbi:XdhC/CoxI family protein [Arthrobacter sp. zg-Y1143]|uniref:XdhC family protein n=1 Tax=Arthrobacter sp. zg-Y1143 TaxID=3049065 RepID=UPI0024C25E1B|nr:XdhC/CoxI family protein [Arthrobacter sp. zg-Y1143]MDK1326530.1 XdhC family protein [Arthrobacter sp. zg-Y1143]